MCLPVICCFRLFDRIEKIIVPTRIKNRYNKGIPTKIALSIAQSRNRLSSPLVLSRGIPASRRWTGGRLRNMYLLSREMPTPRGFIAQTCNRIAILILTFAWERAETWQKNAYFCDSMLCLERLQIAVQMIMGFDDSWTVCCFDLITQIVVMPIPIPMLHLNSGNRCTSAVRQCVSALGDHPDQCP